MQVQYTVTANSLPEIRKIVDLIEGLEAKPEMAQSVVVAAGGGIEQCESGVVAGREPSITGVKDYVQRRLEYYSSLHIGDYHQSSVRELKLLLQWIDGE